MEYNPSICITAKELREMNVAVPEHILDCAWVPLGSYKPREFEATSCSRRSSG